MRVEGSGVGVWGVPRVLADVEEQQRQEERACVLGFRVWGAGCRVQGSGFRVQDSVTTNHTAKRST